MAPCRNSDTMPGNLNPCVKMAQAKTKMTDKAHVCFSMVNQGVFKAWCVCVCEVVRGRCVCVLRVCVKWSVVSVCVCVLRVCVKWSVVGVCVCVKSVCVRAFVCV